MSLWAAAGSAAGRQIRKRPNRLQLFQLIVNCLGKVRAWGRPGPKGLVREREESPSDCGGKDTNFVQIGQMSVRYRCPDCIGSRLSAPPVLFPPGRLPADEGVFARRSVAVVADDARGLDDPVAGNEKHDGIVSERRADRTLRPFVSRLLRQVGVGGQSAARNLEQRVPYLELKCGSLQMQADRLGVAPVPPEDREGPLLVRIGSPVVRGVRKEASQPFEGFVPAFVGEGQVADALGGRGDDDFTERCRSERVADFEAGSAAFVFAGVMPSIVTKRSCRRLVVERPASLAASNSEARVSVRIFFAYSTLRKRANCLGETPTRRWNMRWKWQGLRCTCPPRRRVRCARCGAESEIRWPPRSVRCRVPAGFSWGVSLRFSFGFISRKCPGTAGAVPIPVREAIVSLPVRRRSPSANGRCR